MSVSLQLSGSPLKELAKHRADWMDFFAGPLQILQTASK
ncbi:hypothetical protein PSAB6_50070 [Paraburkholderia sabiae]|nr:hypothetical protein PSAB6_50070 [Paraburkholderia sabiae]